MPRPFLEEQLTYSVIGAGFEVYNSLGYGFREHVYVRALERELIARGHRVSREYSAIIYYKGEQVASDRLDFVVDEKLVLEIKSTERLPPECSRQLFSYLKATSFEIGLVLHFGPKGLGRMRIVRNNDRKAPWFKSQLRFTQIQRINAESFCVNLLNLRQS